MLVYAQSFVSVRIMQNRNVETLGSRRKKHLFYIQEDVACVSLTFSCGKDNYF